MVLVHGTREDAETVREDLADVLDPMGLRLSPAKTQVVHLSDGFDFLGFQIDLVALEETGLGAPDVRYVTFARLILAGKTSLEVKCCMPAVGIVQV